MAGRLRAARGSWKTGPVTATPVPRRPDQTGWVAARLDEDAALGERPDGADDDAAWNEAPQPSPAARPADEERPLSSDPVATPSPAEQPAATAAPHDDERRIGLLPLCILAIVIGCVTGVGAFAFRELIGLVHNLFFLGRYAWNYDSSVFTPPGPWGVGIILAPITGGILVTALVQNFAPEAKGHGVPEVMDAIYYKSGIIRPIVAVVKSLASALAIGSGAAVGREGPIIQIGSALGSTLGQIVHMQAGQRITLVAAGAGAGIAATFNTPIGGVLFATELMLPEISVNTFMPVALATGTATFIGRLFFGAQPAFDVPQMLTVMPDTSVSVATLGLYTLLGAIIGIAAAFFIRSMHWIEDAFEQIDLPYLRHIVGMTLVGTMIYVLQRQFGHYYVEGVGYSTLQAMLSNHITAAWFLLLLFGAKLLATSISLGSGSSGGVFSPSLFMGGTIGAAFAAAVSLVAPQFPISLPAFAMVGMGAMVGSGTGAAMTAVAMIFEMTRDYDIVLPMILAVAVALGVRRILSRENIYTLKLVRRGHPIPKALHANMFMVRSAAEVMTSDVLVLDAATPFAALPGETMTKGGMVHIVVTRAKSIVGVLRVNTELRRAIGTAPGNVTLGEVASSSFVLVRPSLVAFDVIGAMWRQRAIMAVVVEPAVGDQPAHVLGVIDKENVADSVASSIRIYPR
jgi:CIC family chloride channel protein